MRPQIPCPGIASLKGFSLLPSEVQGPRARHTNLPASFNLTGPSSSNPTLRPPDLTVAEPWTGGRSFPRLLPPLPNEIQTLLQALASVLTLASHRSQLALSPLLTALELFLQRGRDRLTFSETPRRFSPPGHSGSPLSPASGLVLCEQVLLPFSSCDGIAAIPGSGEEADKAGLRLSCIHISPGRKTHFQS